MLIRKRRGWEIPERLATPEDVYLNRRTFLRAMGATGLGAMGTLIGCDRAESQPATETPPPVVGLPTPSATADLYPAGRNARFTLDRPLTDEAVAARYNNFYEFSPRKERVYRLVEAFQTRPWQVEVTGLVKKPVTFDIDELVRRMPLEERLYRLRCVEAWSMAVPWTGFPIKAFVDLVEPLSSAKYMRMITFHNPEQAVGMNDDTFPWPYFEGLTMAEATNELALFVTGIYGHELTKQHGAPIRLVVPWKYGYKSIKSIVRVEFLEQQPTTFWSTLVPREYDFWANVNPDVPHPRWSQATERLIGTNERRPTLLYNGYGEFVADLYKA
ncbi:MAG: protein-methionine-sulfoxide reductase catalytic subunit MsrP [Thermodesulfobacteriota bacterium]|jgi:sulfoxide reductase catalytic subunit YedY